MDAHHQTSPPPKRPETIAIISPNRARRDAWGEWLKQVAGLNVAGAWATVEEARRAGVRFDVILLDSSPTALPPERRGEAPLSPREAQVMTLLAGGCRDKELPERLGISAHTVRTFLRRAMAKLGATSRGEAVALWSRLEPHWSKSSAGA